VFVWLFVLIPLVVKLRACLSEYQIPVEIEKDLEFGIMTASISQPSLRVPENGGVE
jgi:hypothetical protein